MNRFASIAVSVAAASMLSACVFAPPSSSIPADSQAITKMSENAVATCGAGNVREVNAKSFSCK
jgi:hypothetical protein